MPTDPPKLLSESQYQCFAALYELTRANGYQPSYSDIAERLGLKARSGVRANLARAEDKGWIRIAGDQRAIRFLYTPSGHVFRGFAELTPEPGAERVTVREAELAKRPRGYPMSEPVSDEQPILLVGTYKQRPDWDDLRDALGSGFMRVSAEPPFEAV